MREQTHAGEGLEKLRELVKDIQIAMLVTADDEGNLRSRPMAMQQIEFDGDLWFMTSEETPKVDEVRGEHHVNVSLANPGKQDYVSLSGTAEIVTDRAKIEELWNPFYKAWFPEGKDDPNIRLIKVSVNQAEYWDAPSSRMVLLYKMAKQAITGKPVDMGEHEKLELDKGYVS